MREKKLFFYMSVLGVFVINSYMAFAATFDAFANVFDMFGGLFDIISKYPAVADGILFTTLFVIVARTVFATKWQGEGKKVGTVLGLILGASLVTAEFSLYDGFSIIGFIGGWGVALMLIIILSFIAYMLISGVEGEGKKNWTALAVLLITTVLQAPLGIPGMDKITTMYVLGDTLLPLAWFISFIWVMIWIFTGVGSSIPQGARNSIAAAPGAARDWWRDRHERHRDRDQRNLMDRIRIFERNVNEFRLTVSNIITLLGTNANVTAAQHNAAFTRDPRNVTHLNMLIRQLSNQQTQIQRDIFEIPSNVHYRALDTTIKSIFNSASLIVYPSIVRAITPRLV